MKNLSKHERNWTKVFQFITTIRKNTQMWATVEDGTHFIWKNKKIKKKHFFQKLNELHKLNKFRIKCCVIRQKTNYCRKKKSRKSRDFYCNNEFRWDSPLATFYSFKIIFQRTICSLQHHRTFCGIKKLMKKLIIFKILSLG